MSVNTALSAIAVVLLIYIASQPNKANFMIENLDYNLFLSSFFFQSSLRCLFVFLLNFSEPNL